MFPLKLNTKIGSCNIGVMEDESWKWHLQFGHLHLNGLKLLSSGGMVRGLPQIEATRQEKSVALRIFREFKALTEAKSNHKLLAVKSDRGGKYTSNAFQAYCKE
ncbi:hypothetical protein ACFX1R_005630 [Malus domestica]